MGFAVADVATLTEATPPDGLRVRAFNPGPLGILGFERGGLLPLSRLLKRFVVGLRPDGELARRIFGLGARLANWTGTTRRAMETDAHHGIARDIPAWRPSDAGLSLGTVGLLCRPVDDEGAQIIALARPPLMTIRPKGWADHVDLMLCLGGDQEVRIDIPAVQQVRAGEEITIGQVLLDGRSHDAIRCSRWGRQHLRNDRRLALVAGFREMDLVADPGDPAFRAVPGVWIVGGGDHLG